MHRDCRAEAAQGCSAAQAVLVGGMRLDSEAALSVAPGAWSVSFAD